MMVILFELWVLTGFQAGKHMISKRLKIGDIGLQWQSMNEKAFLYCLLLLNSKDSKRST